MRRMLCYLGAIVFLFGTHILSAESFYPISNFSNIFNSQENFGKSQGVLALHKHRKGHGLILNFQSKNFQIDPVNHKNIGNWAIAVKNKIRSNFTIKNPGNLEKDFISNKNLFLHSHIIKKSFVFKTPAKLLKNKGRVVLHKTTPAVVGNFYIFSTSEQVRGPTVQKHYCFAKDSIQKELPIAYLANFSSRHFFKNRSAINISERSFFQAHFNSNESIYLLRVSKSEIKAELTKTSRIFVPDSRAELTSLKNVVNADFRKVDSDTYAHLYSKSAFLTTERSGEKTTISYHAGSFSIDHLTGIVFAYLRC